MLTSFFGNSRPINFLILGVFLFIAYLLGSIFGGGLFLSASVILSHVLFIVLTVLSLLILDFIVKKNKLTKANSFAAFFYTFFVAMLPIVFREHDILVANFFLLLALRRIMSLGNDTNSKKKILDASVWIAMASLFYFWSLLLLFPLWMAIIKKPNPDYKQMLVPFTGVSAVLVIYTAYKLLADNSFAWIVEWRRPISLDFSSYNSATVFIPATVILVFMIWSGMYRIYKISTMPLKSRPAYRLLLYVCATCILISLGSDLKTGAELLFIIPPVSILSANYIESFENERYVIKDKAETWFKEILLWLVVVLSIIFLLL